MTAARPRSRAARVALALLAACLLALIAAPAAGAQSTAESDATPAVTSAAPATTGGAATTTAVAPKTTLQEVEKELMCSTCRVPLAQSDAPQAQQERQTIERLIAEGKTKDEIIDEMVLIYSETVLIDPPEANVRTLRWLVPTVVALLAFSLVGFLVVRWRRSTRASAEEGPVDPTAGWVDAPGGPQPAGGETGGDGTADGGISDADRRRLDADLDRYA